jgi:hypothetical protein
MMTRRFVGRLAVGVLGLGVLGLAAWAVWPAPTTPPGWAAEYDVKSRPPERIPPGTVIDRSAPPGWSHLVVKSLPRVRPADRGKVNDLTARMAVWMFTAFLADAPAEPGTTPPRHRLRAVALGLGCSVNGRDTVITPETGEQFGADLGWISRSILTKGYERQAHAVVVFHGPTAALVDTPVWFRFGGKHRLVRFRYALLTDGPGGPLDAVCWMIDPDGKLADPPAAVWLRPDTIDEAELLVDADEFTLGVPSEAAFAVDRLPPGRPLASLPAELWPLAPRSRFTREEARALEAGVRRMLAGGP